MDTLVNAAVFCDKYDMSWALRMWSSIWLERALESASQEDLGKLLQVASSFDLADAFTKISWMIISKQVGPLESRAREHDRVMTEICTGNIPSYTEWSQSKWNLSPRLLCPCHVVRCVVHSVTN